MKKETLEEVAERLFPFTKDDSENRIITIKRLFWVDGAKWQQENSNINALHFEIDSLKREIKVFKHQQERSYSEEDLISLLEFNYKKETNQLGTLRKDYSQKIIKEWFEQFKKK